MKVGVIGRGTVGRAVEELFLHHGEVVAWDLADDALYPDQEYADCDCVFVSVPTPEGEDGSGDVSTVAKVIGRVPNARIVLKSTVPPGSTDRLAAEFDKEICYWPEYIGESAYYNPHFPSSIQSLPFLIVGGTRAARSWALPILQRVLGPAKTYFQCEALEAELVKYAENSFFATKVTFANEFRRICEAHGADWNIVREGWILDPRVSPMHSLAFEHDPGFGGKCLPKDLSAIVESAVAHGYRPDFLGEVQRSNAKFRDEA